MISVACDKPTFFPTLGALLVGSTLTSSASGMADAEGRHADKSAASSFSHEVLDLLNLNGAVNCSPNVSSKPPQIQAIHDASQNFLAAVEAGDVSLDSLHALLALKLDLHAEPSDFTVLVNTTLANEMRKCLNALSVANAAPLLKQTRSEWGKVRLLASVHDFLNCGTKFVNAASAAEATGYAANMAEIFCQCIFLPGLTELQTSAMQSTLRLCIHFCYGNETRGKKLKEMLLRLEAGQVKALSASTASHVTFEGFEDFRGKSIVDFVEATRSMMAAARAKADLAGRFKAVNAAFNALNFCAFKQQELNSVRAALAECINVIMLNTSGEVSRFFLSRLGVMESFVTRVQQHDYPSQQRRDWVTFDDPCEKEDGGPSGSSSCQPTDWVKFDS